MYTIEDPELDDILGWANNKKQTASIARDVLSIIIQNIRAAREERDTLRAEVERLRAENEQLERRIDDLYGKAT